MWVLLHIVHIASTLKCHWLMGGGVGWSSSTLHMSLQLSTANGQLEAGEPPLHCTCHFNSQLPMVDGGMGVSSSTLHMSLQLSTANGQLGGGEPPLHCTCHFYSQLPMADGGWGGCVLLHIANITSTLNCHWLMGVGWVGPPPHCTCHFISQLPMADGGGVLLYIAHVQGWIMTFWGP